MVLDSSPTVQVIKNAIAAMLVELQMIKSKKKIQLIFSRKVVHLMAPGQILATLKTR